MALCSEQTHNATPGDLINIVVALLQVMEWLWCSPGGMPATGCVVLA